MPLAVKIALVILSVAFWLFVLYIFFEFYRAKVKEEHTRDLLRAMEVPCVWADHPSYREGLVHIYLDITTIGLTEAAATFCRQRVVGPYIIGSIEEAYAQGRRLCQKCRDWTEIYLDFVHLDSLSAIETDEE